MSRKLSPHAFTTFWNVHAWAGVVGGLLLYLMFLTGGITLFHEQLAVWEEPLAQQRSAAGEASAGEASVGERSLEATLARGLSAMGSVPEELWFYPPKNGLGVAKLRYFSPGKDTSLWIHDGLTPERERLSEFLFRLHYLWHELTGLWLYYLAGVLAVTLLLALVTGVLIHLKDLVQQFHQFRLDKARRVLWSDMHKVLGVMGLPFQLMYAYTGALIVLGALLVQAFTGPVFGGDSARAERVAWGVPFTQEAELGAFAPGLSLDELMARARVVEPQLVPETFRLRHHGRSSGSVDIRGAIGGVPFGQGLVRLRATDGVVLHLDSPRNDGTRGKVTRWIYGLHFAHFGGITLRVLFFVLALGTCATILTGNWIWLARREGRREGLGNRILARLTAGFGSGTLVAIAALFLVSRVIPLNLLGRTKAEELTFFVTLGLCIAWALAARDGKSLWWRQLGLAGLLLLPVPVLAARWSDAGLFGAGQKLGAVVAIDVALLLVAAALCASAWALRRVALRQSLQQRTKDDPPASLDQTFAGLTAEGAPAGVPGRGTPIAVRSVHD